ncbi:MAG TPA: hypothetical protein PKD64_10450 [Pirellulaceae bacterium]|nr:hypothetical protein [Pirellulaceae bacterium]HMO92601.1 hypothetical protein [Pirellulaceae bacterium]HMP70706.1 hypothetical protein [Pirellulaceae bacterium]
MDDVSRRTIEHVSQLNRAALELQDQWLSRLQLVADHRAFDHSELVFVEKPATIKISTNETHPSASSVPMNKPHFKAQPQPEDASAGPRLDLKDDEPVPQATPAVEERSRRSSSHESDWHFTDTDSNEQSPPSPDFDEDSGLGRLSLSYGKPDLRLDSPHAVNTPHAYPTARDADRLLHHQRDVKRVVDQILKQYPSPASAVLMFVGDESDISYLEAIKLISGELATRLNNPVLLIDPSEQQGRFSAGLAELINRDEPSDVLFAKTDWHNLFTLGAGEGEITFRKSQPASIIRVMQWLRSRFQFTLLAAGGSDDLLANAFARYCDSCYYLIDTITTYEEKAIDQVNRLRKSGARFSGCIMRT